MPLFSEIQLFIGRSARQNARRKIHKAPLMGRFSRKSGRFILDKKQVPLIVAPKAHSNELKPYVSLLSKKLPKGALSESYFIESSNSQL